MTLNIRAISDRTQPWKSSAEVAEALSAGRESELDGTGRLVVGGHGVAVRATGTARSGAGAERFVDDRLDGAGAPAALGAAAETSIDLLGMTHSIIGLGDGGADVVIAQHVTGTNDHGSGRPFSDASSSIFKGPPGCKRKNRYFKLFQTGPQAV
ncbi:hypothetical protein ACVIIW_000295 [Bradyrhizobium sp. USDA 4449]